MATNPYIASLLDQLQGRYSIESRGMTTSEWLCANVKDRGKPFSFDGYAFQRGIVDDLHPDLSVLKISQVGLSHIKFHKEMAMLARNPGRSGIYTLPNEEMYRRFSLSRIQPAYENNPVFNNGGGGVQNVRLLQIGSSFLHIVNATESSATSTPADMVFNDEVDLSDQKMLALFSSRMQNSDMAIKQRFSTPTWVGFGIDASYAASDQREFMCKCRACNHWQIPLFEAKWVRIPGLELWQKPFHDLTDEQINSLPLNEARIVCERCDAPLDLNDPTREWVATWPSRTTSRGYRVRPFSSDRITPAYILRQLIEYRRNDFIRGWHNTVIGEPYTDERSRLSETIIRANMTTPGGEPPADGSPILVGIDVGQVCHIVLGTPQEDGAAVFDFRQVRAADLEDTITEIGARWHIVGGACDRHPYTPTAESVRDQTNGTIMPLEYRGDREFHPVKDAEGEIIHWQANRTKMIDEVARAIRLRRLPMAGYGGMESLLVDHLRDMIREESPETPARWVKLNGNDHFFHALAFMLAGGRIAILKNNYMRLDTRSFLIVGAADMAMPKALFGRSNGGSANLI